MTTLPPSSRLLRGFAVDFLTAHDPSAAERVMDPAYTLHIGGHVFSGRDAAYLPATVAQLDQFPGLCVTCHDVVLSPGAVAMRFTEHGVSARDGRAAAWGGITLFRIDGGRLREGWAEEDYHARKRQLKGGPCDPVAPPHGAPWDEPVNPPQPATEHAVRALLSDPAELLRRAEDMGVQGPSLRALLQPVTISVSTLFTAGDRAAFHAVIGGTSLGGFPGSTPGTPGTPGRLPVAGIVDTRDGRVVRVQLCGDRLGLSRQWTARG